MLSFDKPLSINGITVFRDHADLNQFWYLPGPVKLARQPESDRAAFSFIEYKPAVAGAGIKGGGFAMFETTLKLSESQENRILSEMMNEPGVTQPRLSPVMFESGTVQCIALNLQGSGGTEAAPPPPGAFNVTEKILGTSTPSMDAENRAAFSLTLSQEGAIILKQAFENELAPIGVLYSFVYSGIRPALEVEIKADLKLIFDHFSASLEGQYQWIRAGIDVAFESLKQSGAIKIKIINFTGDEDEKTQEKWALDFFKDELLQKWFEPTFTPGQLTTAAAQADPLAEVAKFTREVLRGEKPAPENNDNKTDGNASGGEKTDKNPATGSEKLIQQPATLKQSSNTTLPTGYSVSHTPSSTGLSETITVTGPGAVVKANGTAQTLNAQGQFTVDVQPSSSTNIEVNWPASNKDETFHLFFDFDKPTQAELNSYISNSAADSRYQNASGIARGDNATWTGSELGKFRLTRWLTGLSAPRNVEVDGHASYEIAAQPSSGNTPLTGDEQRRHNMQLSIRRTNVAEAIIAGAGGVSLSRAARSHGDIDARGTPGNPETGDPNDRVVKIKGRVADGQAVNYLGTISRPESKKEEQKPNDVPKPNNDPKPKPPSSTSTSSMPGVASLKLKFIRQEERKEMTFYYNRAEATRRTYAPQGFIGLFLNDLADKERYFTSVDLDDPFFREFKVIAETPIDYERIGLFSAQVALDYGDVSNPQDVKHGDFIFHSDDKGPKEFTVFLNAAHDVDYQQQQQFHFSPDSGWESDRFSIELPPSRSLDRTLLVNPYEVLDFIEISVTPGDIDAGIVSSTEVKLEARGPGDFNRDKTLIVLPDSPPQIWKLRTPKAAIPDARTITAHLKHYLKDGSVREVPPIELSASVLLVHDPFDDALNIEFIPLFDASAVRQIFIDVEYEDVDNKYHRSERIELTGEQTENLGLRLALLNPEVRTFLYRFTVIGTNGSFQRLAWQTSEEEIVPIQL